MTRLQAVILVLIGAASYGVLATFVKIGYGLGFNVGEITGSQMFLGALMLWGIALFKYKEWKPFTLTTMIKIMVAGTFTGLTGVFYYTSLQTVPASIAIILLFQFTWIGVLYEWVFERKKPTKETYLSLVLVFAGTLLAANVIEGQFQALSLFGILMGLCAAFTFAAFIYVSGRVSTEVTPWLRSPLMITGSFLIIFIIFPPEFLISGVMFEGLWKVALPLAFFGAVLPTVCFTKGVPSIGSGLATILSSLELPVAVFMAWIVFSEAVSVLQWLGVLLILAAIVIGEIKQLSKNKSTQASKTAST